MRTTLTLEDDVHATALALAKQRHVSLGEVVSDLARRGMQGTKQFTAKRNGLRLFPLPIDNSKPVTLDLVKELLEETD
ncbi:MAG: CopG family transcriptional regulator [Chthoniobacterales bacterium]